METDPVDEFDIDPSKKQTLDDMNSETEAKYLEIVSFLKDLDVSGYDNPQDVKDRTIFANGIEHGVAMCKKYKSILMEEDEDE